MEEFSDIPQLDLPENGTTDIPIFSVAEIISPKIIPPQPEKKLPPRDKKVNKQDDSTQALFNYLTEDTRAPVTSTSGTSGTFETSKTSEPIIDELEISKLFNSKPTNEVSSTILLTKV